MVILVFALLFHVKMAAVMKGLLSAIPVSQCHEENKTIIVSLVKLALKASLESAVRLVQS